MSERSLGESFEWISKWAPLVLRLPEFPWNVAFSLEEISTSSSAQIRGLICSIWRCSGRYRGEASCAHSHVQRKLTARHESATALVWRSDLQSSRRGPCLVCAELAEQPICLPGCCCFRWRRGVSQKSKHGVASVSVHRCNQAESDTKESHVAVCKTTYQRVPWPLLSVSRVKMKGAGWGRPKNITYTAAFLTHRDGRD